MTDTKELKSIARFYKDCTEGFATSDGYYAVPIMGSSTKLMVIHDGELLKECSEGFATNDGYYAVPIMGSKTKLMVIHDGELLKECRNESSARNYITKHKKQTK